MVVLIVERVSASVRGELTRWLIQPKTGVFVGSISARVRQRLWERVKKARSKGAAVLIYSSDTEQGFRVESVGDTSKMMVDFEGLILPKTPNRA
jgi:CRISPR-associated protein Cas2